MLAKKNNMLIAVLILMLVVTSTMSSGVYADSDKTTGDQITDSDASKVEALTNEPVSDDFAGYTVKIETGVSDNMADEIDSADNAEQLTENFVQVEDPEDVLEFADPEQITYIEPNYYVYPDEGADDVMGEPNDVISERPNDPDLGYEYIKENDNGTTETAFAYNQWNIEMVKADAAWKEGLRGRGIKVGLIDTGLNSNYLDFDLSRISTGKNFTGSTVTNNANDTALHGTKVASVLFASINNGINMAGLTDLITLTPLKVGNKTTLSTGADVVKAIEYARQNGIQVINMSMGMDQPYKPMEEQINYFSLEGGIFVTSGGNQKRVEPRYPAGCYNSIAVSGITSSGAIWSNSNHNDTIDVAAPAQNTWHILGYRGSGTSYSAPHVTALAAIAKQYSNGKINVTEFKKLLETSSTDMGDVGRDDYYGYGIVNYEEFLNQITAENSNGTAAVVPYPIYYKVNKGTITGDYDSFYFGDADFKLPAIKRTGYKFLGWFANSKFTGLSQTVIKAGETGKKKFYAKWEARKYTVKLNVNKGKKIKTKSKTVSYDSSIGTLPTPKRTGYKFAGWYTKKTGGTQYSRYTTYNKTKSITLYARWTKNNVFKFYPNGGKVDSVRKSVKKKNKIGTMPVPVRSGYKFLGWYTKKSGGKQYTSTMTYDSNKDKKLYARWTKKRIVKFSANGGTVNKYSKAITQGKQLGTLPAPKRQGYRFTGWYTKKSGGSKRTKTSIVKISGSFTVYAHWKKK